MRDIAMHVVAWIAVAFSCTVMLVLIWCFAYIAYDGVRHLISYVRIKRLYRR